MLKSLQRIFIMSNSFEDLIEKFGVPKIVIPNTPRTLEFGGGYMVVGKTPETASNPSNKMYHRRFRYGDSPFLAVASRIETDLSRENELLEHLRGQNLKPIEFLYTYKEVWSSDPSQIDVRAKVAVATDADVSPVSQDDLVRAISEKRFIWAGGWSSMGDAYLTVSLCDRMPTDDCLYFLFDKPGVSEAMLVGIGEYYDRGDEVLDFCGREYFTRYF